MLYTSYLAKLNKLPEDMEKVITTRFSPKWLDMDKYKNLWLMKELSPSQELLLRYKQDKNWDNYIHDFIYEMKNREDMKKKLQGLLAYLKKDENVMLICFEKDYMHCHRSLLGKWFVEQGIEWKEWE